VCPSPPTYDLLAQSQCVDQFRDPCDHVSSYPHDICSYCQSFDHDVNSYPYYDVSDEEYLPLLPFSLVYKARNVLGVMLVL